MWICWSENSQVIWRTRCWWKIPSNFFIQNRWDPLFQNFSEFLNKFAKKYFLLQFFFVLHKFFINRMQLPYHEFIKKWKNSKFYLLNTVTMPSRYVVKFQLFIFENFQLVLDSSLRFYPKPVQRVRTRKLYANSVCLYAYKNWRKKFDFSQIFVGKSKKFNAEIHELGYLGRYCFLCAARGNKHDTMRYIHTVFGNQKDKK